MTCCLVAVHGWLLKTAEVKMTEKDKHTTATGQPWPLNRGGCLILPGNKYSISTNKNSVA